MAGIDKTYVTKTELLEAIDWAKKVGEVKLENGYEFSPLNWIYGYNDLDDPHYFDEEREEYVLWNTPTWLDRWLWLNCPLSFVKERLKFQYGDDSLKEFEDFVYHNPKHNLDFGKQHYTFLKVPKFPGVKWYMNNMRYKNPWPGNCRQVTYYMEVKCGDAEYRYCAQTDTWEEMFGMMPTDNEYIWQNYHKRIPNKKSIIRELRRWYFPKGTIIRLWSLGYNCFDFKIRVK